jgi:hypothetical protein
MESTSLWCRAQALSWRLLGCDAAFAGSLLVAQLWLALLWFFYQGHGVVRGVILCGLLAGLIALRMHSGRTTSRGLRGPSSLTPALRLLLIAAVLLDVAMMAVSSTRSIETSKIPMDEGVTSWRAARLFVAGENPYATGALVDLSAYRSRAVQRTVAGQPSMPAGPALGSALTRYDKSLDSGLRRQLLPISAHASGPAARESRLYGYKYGPVILLATAPLVLTGLPGLVLVLNGLVCFGFFSVNWRILSRISGLQFALAGAGMLALLLDRHITRNYIDRSATDVWALLFGSLAVLAFLSRRPLATAVSVALAIGCKSMPGLLFLPLLFRFRSTAPVLVFIAATATIFLPWLLWDPAGLLYNVFLWPFYMATDATSWEYFAPPWAALGARAVAVVCLCVLWLRYLMGNEPRLFWTLAMSSTIVLLASGFLRNGYIPWASVWVVGAIVEDFAQRRPVRESAPVPAMASQPSMSYQ